MKVEALNCPNCGAAVSSDKTQCQFCTSRLKTMACPSCLGLLFMGSKHCSHCGKKTVETQIDLENQGNCPRCGVGLNLLQIAETSLRECKKCDGLWADVETFENICAEKEKQSAVLSFIGNRVEHKLSEKVKYVACPDCKQLMNRNNFARSSGVILDICKAHGVWFDSNELPKIIEFIHKGGLEHSRERQKVEIRAEIDRLRDKQREAALQNRRFEKNKPLNFEEGLSIRSFIKELFE